MTGKTKKVLEEENSKLKDELKNLKSQYENSKCKCKVGEEKENTNFKCIKCDKCFTKFKDFKKHKGEHKLENEIFKCGQCGRTFDEDWKMNAHMKTHNNYNCGQCEKSFKNVELLKKHSKITHENLKMYCHYYNNSKTCPFKEECLFLHVEAPICKYGKLCERMFCMFKHVPETDEEHGDVEEIIENDVVNSVTEVMEESIVMEEAIVIEEESRIVDIDDPDDTEHDDDVSNATFLNPSQDDKLPSAKNFKCEMCNFFSSTRPGINDHKVNNHNWCSLCYSSFSSQNNLKKHRKKKHTQK